jgi:hypothetical protein
MILVMTGGQKEGGSSAGGRVHPKVSVEVVSVPSGLPIGILELDIRPRPLIIDRTFRCVLVHE